MVYKKYIMIRKNDKFNIFVILSRTDYNKKLDSILNNIDKFTIFNNTEIGSMKLKKMWVSSRLFIWKY